MTTTECIPLATDAAGSDAYGQVSVIHQGKTTNDFSLHLALCLDFSGTQTGSATSGLTLTLNSVDALRFMERWCGGELLRLIEQTLRSAESQYWVELSAKAKELRRDTDDTTAFTAGRQELYRTHQVRVDELLTLELARALYRAVLLCLTTAG